MIFLLFILFPIAEIWLLIEVISRWGFMNTFFALVLSAVIGLSLARTQGGNFLRHLQENLARGEVPPEKMLHGVLKFLSGVLFIIPGFLSDVIAIVLLLPGTRHLFAWWLKRKMASGLASGSFRVVNFGGGSFTGGFRGGFAAGGFKPPPRPGASGIRDVTPTEISGSYSNTSDGFKSVEVEVIDVTPISSESRPKPKDS